jgi:ElaB/YqjD/DUF883 family membrane-anchored ribosome-binding protein
MLNERAISELQDLLAELEKVLTHSGADLADQAQETVANWQGRVKAVQERLGKLQRQAEHQFSSAARSAERSLRENPWRAVAIAAVAGLLAGLALGSRERSGPQEP